VGGGDQEAPISRASSAGSRRLGSRGRVHRIQRNPDSSLAYIHLLGREMAAKLPKACGIVHAWRVTMVAGEGHRPGHSERAAHPAGPRPQFSLGELLQSRKHRFPSRASKYLVVAYWGSTSPQLRGGR
jgi:hypothetical protein